MSCVYSDCNWTASHDHCTECGARNPTPWEHHTRCSHFVPATAFPHSPGDKHRYELKCIHCGQLGQVTVSVEPQEAE